MHARHALFVNTADGTLMNSHSASRRKVASALMHHKSTMFTQVSVIRPTLSVAARHCSWSLQTECCSCWVKSTGLLCSTHWIELNALSREFCACACKFVTKSYACMWSSLHRRYACMQAAHRWINNWICFYRTTGNMLQLIDYPAWCMPVNMTWYHVMRCIAYMHACKLHILMNCQIFLYMTSDNIN